MDGQLKPKVTAKIDYNRARPPSPFKQQATSLSPPLIRPKAKVNSSATIQARKPAASVSSPVSVRGSVASTRAPSPFKPPQSRTANASSAGTAVKARLTARTNGSNSTSPLPESRQRALTAATTSPAPSFPRQRRGSASSNLLPSSSRTEISTAPSPVRSALALSSHSDENTPTTLPSASTANVNVRVRAKISKVADPGGVHSPPSHPASPLLTNRPARVPSISSLSLSPPMMPSNSGYSPSSTSSSPLAPPLRFGSTRETKHQSYQAISKAFQAFIPNDDLAVDYGGTHKIVARVDPAAIPLPPHSPPISTLSFSSRSSASRSSVSYDTQDTSISRSTAPTLNSHLNGNGHARHGSRSSPARASLDGLGLHKLHSAPATRDESSNSDGEYSDEYDSDARHHAGDSDDEERKMKAQAKSNRKIADLEITNRSLLAINATLEATKHKQQKEIRELRRKLRESRLILPPPAYRAVKSSLSQDEIAAEEEEDEEEDDDEDDEENKQLLEGKADEAYRRVKGIIDSLLESGRRALESKPEDFVGSSKSGGAKVLTAEEVRTWRGDDDATETRSNLDVDLDDRTMAGSRPLTPSRVAVPDSDDDLGSEGEVEASLLEPDVQPPAPLPPITITPSAPQ
ncbi:hypothetical protein C8Q80DRAFT_1092953 [Daedaleopsis nitida]|nr:hypothetical protein C8Q80DRAFT_1092953 [Daedaleopsis nitida]